MEIRDFMTKENLEMIGLAVMCDRFADDWSGYGARNGIHVSETPQVSASFNNFENMVKLGKDISMIMEFFETLNGECRIKNVSEYLKEKGASRSIRRITTVCRRLCASGYLKQRYSDPYKITVKTSEWDWDNYPKRKEVTKEIEVRDSLYSLA